MLSLGLDSNQGIQDGSADGSTLLWLPPRFFKLLVSW